MDIRPEGSSDAVLREDTLCTRPEINPEKVARTDGLDLLRFTLPVGETQVSHDAIFEVPFRLDHDGATDLPAIAPEALPGDVIDYVRPSRFCESDRLADFAWRQFGNVPTGWEQVKTVCTWVHEHVEYRFGAGRSDLTACNIFEQRYGVCRDFAHLTIALCRALNVPARYASGHLPDIGYDDPGSPMDFHAYTEVYLGGRWVPVDARYNVSRFGRVRVCHGLDAGDCAFLTSFGTVNLNQFQVWAYQIENGTGSTKTPVDLTQRLDGQTKVFHRLADRPPVPTPRDTPANHVAA
ncbi:transglutaminase-like domain-containing protein [Synoicihabitans lomoniglobus]|uniref:Transglutaminase family protein n=1 Tax=Synoicihabitans lomoniglobus TaxID=2909285 RepID=A0AAE9ZTP0_9BACT|nr:transglutaminase family protein [Opitutaceae bacterium LMO-M01]WED63116.1 transglutaminase family protein [Opitutaceae bacterium LMO-M01]